MRASAALTAALLPGLLAATPALGAEYVLEPVARLTADYISNPRLLENADQAAEALALDVSLSASRRMERSSAFLRAGAISRRHRDYELLDVDDQTLAAGFSNTFEHGAFSLDARVMRDHTLTSELETTGFVEVNQRRMNYQGAALAEWRPDELMALGLQLGWIHTDYQPDPLRRLVDYDYPTAQLFVQKSSSDRTVWSLTASAGSLQGSQVVFRARDYALRAGVQRTFSERWQGGFSIGPSRLEPRFGDAVSGLAFTANLQHRGERTRLSFDAQRARTPNGNGVLSDQTSVGTRFSRQLSEHLSLELGLRAVRTEDRYGNAFFTFTQRRNYGRVDAGLAWQWAPHWRLSANGAWYGQDYVGAGPTADSAQASLSVSWSGWREAVSR